MEVAILMKRTVAAPCSLTAAPLLLILPSRHFYRMLGRPAGILAPGLAPGSTSSAAGPGALTVRFGQDRLNMLKPRSTNAPSTWVLPGKLRVSSQESVIENGAQGSRECM